jgi:hypothetical protein
VNWSIGRGGVRRERVRMVRRMLIHSRPLGRSWRGLVVGEKGADVVVEVSELTV